MFNPFLAAGGAANPKPTADPAADRSPFMTVTSATAKPAGYSRKTDYALHKRNLDKLIAANAADEDFDAYLNHEGVTMDGLRALKPKVSADGTVPQQQLDENGVPVEPLPTTPGEQAEFNQKRKDQWRLLANGVTLGFADEIEGGVNKLVGNDYAASRDAARESIDRARQQPGGAALELAGGFLVPGLGAGRVVANGATAAARIARGTGVGAVTGGASGLGNAEGEIGDQAARTALGTGFGAVIGAGGTGLVEGLKPVARGLMARFNIGNEAAAQRFLRDAIEREAEAQGVPVGQIAQRWIDDADTQIARTGVATPLALNGSENTVALAHSAAAASPRARETIRQLGSRERDEIAADITGRIDDITGGPQNYQARLTALTDGRADDAAAAYTDMYARSPNVNLSAIDWRAPGMRDAVRTANKWLANGGEQRVTNPADMTARQADYVARALDDQVTAAFAGNAPESGHMLRALRDRYLADVQAQMPMYGPVRNTYADRSAGIRALKNARALPTKEGAAADETRALIEANRAAHPDETQLGVLQGLRDAVNNSGDAAVWAGKHSADERARRLAELLRNGNDPRATALADAIPQQAQAARAANTLLDGLPAAETALQRAASGIDPTKSVRPGTTLIDVGRGAARLALDQMNEQRAQMLARMLTGDSRPALFDIARQRAGASPARVGYEGFLQGLNANDPTSGLVPRGPR